MASPYQKKMVRSSKIRSKMVSKKKTKMEENKTYQTYTKIEKTKNTD